jgi:hypothetical protein
MALGLKVSMITNMENSLAILAIDGHMYIYKYKKQEVVSFSTVTYFWSRSTVMDSSIARVSSALSANRT